MRPYQLMIFLRLLVVIPLLAFSHIGVAGDYISGGGGVPPSAATDASAASNSSIPPTSGYDAIVDGVKTGADKLKNGGKAISGYGTLVGNTDTSFGGKGVSAIGGIVKGGIEFTECLETPGISCGKSASSTAKGLIDMAEMGSKVPGPVKTIVTVGDIAVTGTESVIAIKDGDPDKALSKAADTSEKLFDVGLTVVSPPLGVAKGVADAACNIAAGKSCLKVKTQKVEAWEQEGIMHNAIVFSGGQMVMPMPKDGDDFLGMQKSSSNLSEFDKMSQQNKLEAEKKKQAVVEAEVAKQTFLAKQEGPNISDFLNIVSDVYLQQSNKAGASQSCNKVYNTPDGCHPGHDEKAHAGGCRC